MALIFIRVHSPLFFCHFSTTIFHMRCPVADHYFLSLFIQNVQIRVTLSLLNCDLFTLSVQILVMAPKIVCGTATSFTTVNIYCLRHIVDLVVLLVYYLDCVDRSGSLSRGAFNQLRLVTLNIVLTILY